MRRILMVALAATGVAAIPAGFVAAQSPAAQQAESGDDDLDRVVCRRESVVGSRVQKRRVCMTRREMMNRELQTRDRMGIFIRESTAGAPR